MDPTCFFGAAMSVSLGGSNSNMFLNVHPETKLGKMSTHFDVHMFHDGSGEKNRQLGTLRK